MDEQIYLVFWHINHPSTGFFEGRTNVQAKSESDASYQAQIQVWERYFTDLRIGRGAVKIDEIRVKGNGQ